PLDATDRAIVHLRAAVDTRPDSSEARIALAHVLGRRDGGGALAELRRVIQSDPTQATAYRALADVCEREGNGAAAALLHSAGALLDGQELPMHAELMLRGRPTPVPSALSADDALRATVGSTRAAYVRQVVELLDPHLHRVFTEGQDALPA